ncbi:hypothetical protein WA026_017700 [Henosepilachna vigintioctopunctata]|uniref:C2H2-type domain-containing protein n=1 Tax=Henosepilachna vigintioctopunctata TaxID=420089 RepID=A0AAW1U9N7_9CUCU
MSAAGSEAHRFYYPISKGSLKPSREILLHGVSLCATKKNLQDHQRRYCRGPVEPDEETICKECGREFTTYIGMRNHYRQAHPIEYNDEMYEEAHSKRSNDAWTDGDREEMAMAEARYNSEILLDHLALITRRSKEAVRKKRYAMVSKTSLSDAGGRWSVHCRKVQLSLSSHRIAAPPAP